MTRSVSDDELRQVHAVFADDHARLRDELLSAIARGEQRAFPQRAVLIGGRRRLAAGFAVVAASVLISLGVWVFFGGVAPSTAYSFDDIRGQLLKIRSLHVTGWTYHTRVVDGQERVEKFPFEYYEERPSRRWNTWYGFMPDEVRSGYAVGDGTRSLYVSHTERKAILGKQSQLSAELGVEVTMQNQWAQRLTGGVPAAFQPAGREEVNGVQALRFESTRETDGSKTRTVVWLHPQTRFPVRSADYVVENGRERLQVLNERIEINVPPPRPEMFSFRPPEGYVVERAPEESEAPFVQAMASGGGRESAIREIFSIDDRAILVCWMNQPRPGEEQQGPNAVADSLKIKLELFGEPARRTCRRFPVRDQQDRNQVWHWSLVVPLDRQPIHLSECLAVSFASRKSRMSFENCPLRFEEARLAKLLIQLQQETFSEQPEGESPFTLEGLRKQLSAIVAQPLDGDDAGPRE